MAIVYTSMPELKGLVKTMKEKFPEQLNHIKPDGILYLNVSKPKSSYKAKIGPISRRFAHLFPEVYFLEIHKESWDGGTEGDRLYTILHELLHIPDEGFVVDSKQYRKTVKHDIQDFKVLVAAYGLNLENVDKLTKKVK